MTTYCAKPIATQAVADECHEKPVNKIMADYLRRRLRDNPASQAQLDVTDKMSDAQLLAAYKAHKGLL